MVSSEEKDWGTSIKHQQVFFSFGLFFFSRPFFSLGLFFFSRPFFLSRQVCKYIFEHILIRLKHWDSLKLSKYLFKDGRRWWWTEKKLKKRSTCPPTRSLVFSSLLHSEAWTYELEYGWGPTFKVVLECLKRISEPFLIYIYGIQCDFMPKSCWKHSNFENR